MRTHLNRFVIVAGSLLAVASSASADFTGQTIIGPLSAGSNVAGTTLGAPDLNDGFESGGHPFGIWDGGDRVYGLNWLGGDINITLNSLGGSDNDLFLYTPDDLNSSSIFSTIGAIDNVQLDNAAAGFYYIVVDSQFFSEGAFNLSVAPIPAPGAAAVFALALLGRGGRRRSVA